MELCALGRDVVSIIWGYFKKREGLTFYFALLPSRSSMLACSDKVRPLYYKFCCQGLPQHFDSLLSIVRSEHQRAIVPVSYYVREQAKGTNLTSSSSSANVTSLLSQEEENFCCETNCEKYTAFDDSAQYERHECHDLTAKQQKLRSWNAHKLRRPQKHNASHKRVKPNYKHRIAKIKQRAVLSDPILWEYAAGFSSPRRSEDYGYDEYFSSGEEDSYSAVYNREFNMLWAEQCRVTAECKKLAETVEEDPMILGFSALELKMKDEPRRQKVHNARMEACAVKFRLGRRKAQDERSRLRKDQKKKERIEKKLKRNNGHLIQRCEQGERPW